MRLKSVEELQQDLEIQKKLQSKKTSNWTYWACQTRIRKIEKELKERQNETK